MHSYCIAGLLVDSEIAMPGLIPGPLGRGACDVSVRRDGVPAGLGATEASGPTWEIAGDRFLLRIPGIARFLLTNGRDIAFEPEGETPLEDVTAFLIGTVFGTLLHQRGRIALHASAVRVGDKAVLFCGASGEGKSTMAAALVRRGFPLVTDDVCAVSFDGSGAAVAHPDGCQLKLWARTVERLGMAEARGAAVRGRLEKYHVEPNGTCLEPLPLGAVYVLREAKPPHEPGISRPKAAEAVLLFRRNAYRPLLVKSMGRKKDYFFAAAAIAGNAGIFHLTRGLNFDVLPDVVSRLERHWAEIGLTETPG